MTEKEIPTKAKMKDGELQISVGATKEAKEEFANSEETKDAEIERLRIDRDDLSSKLDMIAEKQFSIALEKAKSEGAPSEITTVEELESWREQKHKNPALTTGGGGSGKAPLNPSEKEAVGVKEYADYSEMVADLNERSRSNDVAVREEAKDILNKLHEKAQKDKKSFTFEKEIDIGALLKQNVKNQNEQLKKIVDKEDE